MKRFSMCAVIALLALASALVHGCREKGGFTLLFTSDVKGYLVPAG